MHRRRRLRTLVHTVSCILRTVRMRRRKTADVCTSYELQVVCTGSISPAPQRELHLTLDTETLGTKQVFLRLQHTRVCKMELQRLQACSRHFNRQNPRRKPDAANCQGIPPSCRLADVLCTWYILHIQLRGTAPRYSSASHYVSGTVPLLTLSVPRTSYRAERSTCRSRRPPTCCDTARG